MPRFGLVCRRAFTGFDSRQPSTFFTIQFFNIMEVIQIQVYLYSELSEEAKRVAHNEYLQGFEYPWYNDVDATMKRISEVFGIGPIEWRANADKVFCSYERADDDTGERFLPIIIQNGFEPHLWFEYDFVESLKDNSAKPPHEAMKEALSALLKSVQNDIWQQTSEEFFQAECDEEGRLFFKNGNRVEL